ncbi:hypothetical protein BDV30DRAFT_237668 [Aspergillus minisclerotigenes]|uniref:Uncharacterized protein n=1 Tax=Aspergillus minisclerotigenes TaxID=656917 RepID=A0A5N6J893_9EURO|nr:hypothetical protein BDV30DRAFT_237668 [Aspergillus minisclerotigenes]
MPPPKDLINISGIPKDALRKELLEALKSSIIKEDTKEFLKDHHKLSWFIDEGLRYAVKVYVKPKDFVDASGLGERCDADTVRLSRGCARTIRLALVHNNTMNGYGPSSIVCN